MHTAILVISKEKLCRIFTIMSVILIVTNVTHTEVLMFMTMLVMLFVMSADIKELPMDTIMKSTTVAVSAMSADIKGLRPTILATSVLMALVIIAGKRDMFAVITMHRVVQQPVLIVV